MHLQTSKIDTPTYVLSLAEISCYLLYALQIRELNSLAQDRKQWQLIMRQAMDTNRRWSHGSWKKKKEDHRYRPTNDEGLNPLSTPH